MGCPDTNVERFYETWSCWCRPSLQAPLAPDLDLSARGPRMKIDVLTLLTVLFSSCIALDACFSLLTTPLAVGLCQRIWVPLSIPLVFILEPDLGSEISPGATPIHTIKPFPQCLSSISTISSSLALSLPSSMLGTLVRHQQLICSTSFFLMPILSPI
jgi:hypothetical protein